MIIKCKNTKTGTIYDITQLVDEFTHDTFVSDQPGKCSFTVLDDPGGQLEIVNGSQIDITHNGKGLFYGYVFSMETSEDKKNKIVAYDQIRYLNNQEIYITSGMTASEVFEMICKDTNTKYSVITPSVHVAEDHLHRGKIYETIKYGIDRSIIYEEDKYYIIRDNYGTLEFTELGQLKTNYIIGDESLLTSYTYKIDIDSDTFNFVKVTQDQKDIGRIWSYVAHNSETQAQWGKLQMIQDAGDKMNEAQIIELAENLLKLKDREKQTLKLTAIGISDLTAGAGFTLDIRALGIKQDMWIKSASHTYKEGYHMMTLEAAI